MCAAASCLRPVDWADPAALREMTLTNPAPLLFSNCISDWPAHRWTLPYLAAVLQDDLLLCRLGLKNNTDLQWETDCKYEEVRLREFSDWLSGAAQPDNPLLLYDRDKYWAYVDYKYMKDVFASVPHMLKEVRWERFGFGGRTGRESTIWLGSEQAYTLGHYDTYGCNLVAQVSGRKRWILFPPDQTDCLYPSRVPYEESSVFSDINIARPDLHKFPKFKWTTPYMVTLEPGDVLLVPRHWWHFVECLEPSISVNTWLELEADHEARVGEALTSTLVCSFMAGSQAEEEVDFLNPNQDFLSLEENMEAVERALLAQMQARSALPDESGVSTEGTQSVPAVQHESTVGESRKRAADEKHLTEAKLLGLDVNTDRPKVFSMECTEPAAIELKKPAVTDLKPSSFEEYLTEIQRTAANRTLCTKDPVTPESVRRDGSMIIQSDRVKDPLVSLSDIVKDPLVSLSVSLSDSVKDPLVSQSDRVKDPLVSQSDNVKDTLVSQPDNMKDLLVSQSDRVKDPLVSQSDNVKDTLVSLSDNVKDTLVSQSDKVKDQFVSQSDTVRDPLLSQSDAVKDPLTSQFDTVRHPLSTPSDTLRDPLTSQPDTVRHSLTPQSDKVRNPLSSSSILDSETLMDCCDPQVSTTQEIDSAPVKPVQESSPSSLPKLSTRTLVNCFTHPRVIALVSDLLTDSLDLK